MRAFSKRHRRSLEAGQLQVELTERVGGRLRRLLERHSESFRTTDEPGFNYYTDDLAEVGEELRDLYGADVLPGAKTDDVAGLVKAGRAEHAFDVVELFAERRSDGSA